MEKEEEEVPMRQEPADQKTFRVRAEVPPSLVLPFVGSGSKETVDESLSTVVAVAEPPQETGDEAAEPPQEKEEEVPKQFEWDFDHPVTCSCQPGQKRRRACLLCYCWVPPSRRVDGSCVHSSGNGRVDNGCVIP